MHDQTTLGSPMRRRALALFVALLSVTWAVLALSGCSSGATTTTSEATPTTEATATTTPAEDQAAFPVTVTDDNGVEVTVTARPERIVSTAPANTEILFALGAGDRVVGVTSLDDYPPEVADIEKIGDFSPNTEAIIALEPDLVVGYSGNEEALQPLVDAGIPVLILNAASIDGIYTDMTIVGNAIGEPKAAEDLIATVRVELEGIANTAAETGESPKVFYALDDTLWTVGPGSFVDELITLAGATNVAANGPSPYFQYTPEELVAADPDAVILPMTVFSTIDAFAADPRFAALRAVKEGRVYLVDDITVTRPGPRVTEGLTVLAKALHPDAF
ncbi:MAG TPA: ABC transporter substrate-binding protein [Thermoleophilia bacterium]|nr:ABC transporter substrate-binding protein [Thermoleophilia bacterium]